MLGLPELIPLGPHNMGRSLGPGYDIGYFAWEGLTARPDGCMVEPGKVEELRETGQTMRSAQISTFEEFMSVLKDSGYHEDGHLNVGYCQGGNGPMAYSQVSARDPIFWRWHKHVSDFVRQISNRILPG